MISLLRLPLPAIWLATLACVAIGASGTRASAAPAAAAIEASLRKSMTDLHLKAAIVEVRSPGSVAYRGALGDSMAGVPATADMRFRNGALAFTYMSTLLLEFVDQKKTTLDTKLAAYFPHLPNATSISLRNLAQMTSGYADYVYQTDFQNAFYGDPFRQFTPEELVQFGVTKPIQFPAGTNWSYSHTNYVILGRVLEKISGMPLSEALQQGVLGPMGLHDTVWSNTPAIPPPVLHGFTSERRTFLGIKPQTPFSEEGTFWNPSWTTIDGAVETTTIDDLCTSLEAVGTGKLLSAESHDAQVKPTLLGFGHTQANCPACRRNTPDLTYGLGIIDSGKWIVQTLGFAGASGAVGYLPQQRLTVAIEVTNLPAAYDAEGNAGLGATEVFRSLVETIAPGTLSVRPGNTGA